MKRLFEKWFDNDDKLIQLTHFDKWPKPRFSIYTNGAKRKAKDRCFSLTIDIWKFSFNYTNWNLQNEPHKKSENNEYVNKGDLV